MNGYSSKKATEKIDNRIVLGIDVGGTSVKLGLVDKQGALKATGRILTNADKMSFWQDVGLECRLMLAENHISWEAVLGVGIGIPGLVNSDSGHVYLAPNLGWYQKDILSELEKIFPVSVKIENDANLAALGEAWKGAGRRVESMIMITVGTGIGSGFIYRNQIYKGQGVATEMGHMVIERNGPKCSCGNLGCLEVLAAAPALIRRMTELLQNERVHEEDNRQPKLTVRQVFDRAEAGDQLALEAITETASCLGTGIASVINIFNPQRVILGGGVIQGGQIFFQPMLAEIQKRTLSPAREQVQILPAELGNNAGVVGAGALFWLEGAVR